MADRRHHYSTRLVWTGGQEQYGFLSAIMFAPMKSARRENLLSRCHPTPCVAAGRWNPEDLLAASLSACHKIWYMGLCAAAGIVVPA
jgi:organic hydroperoxide reductase OsmC/OhrA